MQLPMSEPMPGLFHLTKRDMVRAVVLDVTRLTPLIWSALVLLGLASGVELLQGWLHAWPHPTWPHPSDIYISIFFISTLFHLVMVVWSSGELRVMREEHTVILLDDGVRFDSSQGNSMLTWDLIIKWRHNAHYVLIYSAPRLYHVVPATVATQGFDVERLKAALTRHVGPAGKNRK